MGILGHLALGGGPTTPGALANDLGISTARVANALKSLERKGFIRREVNPKDRRGVIVSITEEGTAFGEARFAEACADVRNLLSALSPEEGEALLGLISKLATRLRQRGDPPNPPSAPPMN